MKTFYRPSSQNQSHPNSHLLFAKLQKNGTLHKTSLAQNRPKKEKQREILINYTAKSPNLKTRKIILFQDSKSCFRIYNLGSIARKLSRQDFDNLENKIQNLENKIQNLENKI